MRMAALIIGVLAVLAGIVWILQGLNILGGSYMSGHIQYSVLGLVVGLIGVGLIVFGARRRGSKV